MRPEKRSNSRDVLMVCVLAGVMMAGTRDSTEAFAAEGAPKGVEDSWRVRDPAAAPTQGETGKGNRAPNARRGGRSSRARTKNDTQGAPGMTYEQVLALQKELRGLVDIAKAPSARETEIINILRRKTPPLDKVEVELVDGGIPDERVRNTANRSVQAVHNEGEAYLKMATQYADLMITVINDPGKGVIVPADNARAPVYVKYIAATHKNYDQSVAFIGARFPRLAAEYKASRKPLPVYMWLSTAMVLEAPVDLAHWILHHPQVHRKAAPQIEGLRYRTGQTYREKATFWLLRARQTFEHFEKHRFFDEKIGVWRIRDRMVPDDPRSGTLPTNRFMIFNSVYLATAVGLQKIDAKEYDAFYQRAVHIVQRGFEFWTRISANGPHLGGKYPTENEFGPLYVWGYSLNGSSEDMAHLGMDMSGVGRIIRHRPDLLAKEDLRAIANTLYSGTYDYAKHVVFKGLFRDPQPPGAAVYRHANPRYGQYIGRHMPDKAYERFVKENLAIWDRRLEKGLLGRQDTYNAYFEVYGARRARFARN